MHNMFKRYKFYGLHVSSRPSSRPVIESTLFNTILVCPSQFAWYRGRGIAPGACLPRASYPVYRAYRPGARYMLYFCVSTERRRAREKNCTNKYLAASDRRVGVTSACIPVKLQHYIIKLPARPWI